MKRSQMIADKRKTKKRKKASNQKLSEEQRTFFLPSLIPAELISQIFALLDYDECEKLVFLNREWRSKIWSFLTSFTIAVTENGHLVDQLAKTVTSLEVEQFEQNEDEDYAPIVDWVRKFTNLRDLKLIPPLKGAVEKIALLVPSLTSLTVEYSTKYKEFLHMTNLRALSVQSENDYSILKGLVNMHQLHTLYLDGSSSTKSLHFNYISLSTALTHLTLYNCSIQQMSLLHLTALTNLKELAINSCTFIDKADEDPLETIKELKCLRELEVLQMEDMSVGDTDLIEFKKMTQLTIAEMSQSFELPPNLKLLKVRVLDATVDKYIDKFINLESIDVKLNDDETNNTFESISKLQQLTMLRIMFPFLKKMQKGLKALTSLPRLKVLKFWITRRDNITADMILQIISEIPSLTRFHCNNKEHLDSIRHKLPHMLCL